jgi:hypothetical protein
LLLAEGFALAHSTAARILEARVGVAAASKPADVRLAVFGVGFLRVAVDVSISDGATTGLAGLAPAVVVSGLAVDLAPVLELTRGDRAHARLGAHVGHWGRRPRRGVDLGVGIARAAHAFSTGAAGGADGFGVVFGH